jgi:hypothetical protein
MSMPSARVPLLACAIAVAGCANQPAPERVAARDPKPYCLRETGTKLAVPEGKCGPGQGRSVTREELEQSGGMTVSDSLNRVVPR